jgi:hypothetical protein
MLLPLSTVDPFHVRLSQCETPTRSLTISRARTRTESNYSRSFSTVRQDFAVKRRNSAKRCAKQVTWSQPLKTACAMKRKPTQKLSLELEIRCSIRLSYGRSCAAKLPAASVTCKFYRAACDEIDHVCNRTCRDCDVRCL